MTEVGGGIRVAGVLDPFGNAFRIIENPHFQPVKCGECLWGLLRDIHSGNNCPQCSDLYRLALVTRISKRPRCGFEESLLVWRSLEHRAQLGTAERP